MKTLIAACKKSSFHSNFYLSAFWNMWIVTR